MSTASSRSSLEDFDPPEAAGCGGGFSLSRAALRFHNRGHRADYHIVRFVVRCWQQVVAGLRRERTTGPLRDGEDPHRLDRFDWSVDAWD